MNLIKKTVVLTGREDGYLSVVRVGDDVGMKVVGQNFSDSMIAGVKLGERLLAFPLTGARTEKEYDDVDFKENDRIGCVIAQDGKVIARGGLILKVSDVTEELAFAPAVALPSVEEGEKETEEKPIEDAPQESKESEDEREELLFRLAASDGAVYYTGVREKLDELFVIHPVEDKLKSAFPDSEWIKINYDGEDYYVVGRLREEGRVTLIGYGVPGKERVLPPKIASGVANFLKVEGLPSGYDGYWLLFQDATTGKLVK
ncbi:MAG: hypothetical protein IJ735_04675 [Clostridia bacterium]|nr:hypothetical protein [Clostridia bacterium]